MSENKKRSRLYVYGERTTGVSILVPESKKAEITAKFYEVLKEYENPKMLYLEKTTKPDIPKKNQGIMNSLDRSRDEELTEKVVNHYKDDSLMEFLNKTGKSESIEEMGVLVSSLPKDKKKIDVGLYSGSGKFYTNKIVSNELKILEWTNIESAKSYLENLK